MMLLYAFSVLLFTAPQWVTMISREDQELIVASSIGNTAAVQQLIAKGAHVDAHDNLGMTALHWAAENGHEETAKILIEVGAKINAKDFLLNTPLHIACSHDHFDVIKLLLQKGADISEVNLMNVVPLDLCTIKDRLKPTITQMKMKGTHFIDAVKKGQKELASWLIVNGANVYETYPDGFTLYNLAESKGMILPRGIDRFEMIDTAEQHLHQWLQENPPQKEIEQHQKRNGHSLTWQAYHSFNDIVSFLKYLANKYSKLCTLQYIGTSHENRSLIVLKISNGNPRNKAIWIDGGIHAREWISPAAVTYIVNNFVQNWSKQPAHVKNINWYILAVHNPDGYEYSRQIGNRLWRKNRNPNGFIRCAGVDLNRNYGFDWGKTGFIGDPCDDEYGGTCAFSEPETEAVRNFFEKTNELFRAFLTFHSFGQCVLYPINTDFNEIDRRDLVQVVLKGVKQMQLVNKQVHTVETDDTLYLSPGSSESWARSLGIEYAYTIELRDKGRYGFLLPSNQIEVAAREAQAFILTVTQAIFQGNAKN
ncbi:carboxypeptidase B-like isoform X2 [Contarinia nasturtii]|uniref:carboxypeptidase B-like isoform X2 n=1 Tax=Contarinia nasturtii TaxID=265458 RepID=UPI0012D499C7|nr:carboxypeptidase B-like isoform X2 [Contarinia nasturtii]